MKKLTDMQKRIALSVLIGTALSFLVFYIALPPINLRAEGFWVFLTAVMLFYAIPFIAFGRMGRLVEGAKGLFKKPNQNYYHDKTEGKIIPRPFLIALCVPVAVIILGSIISSPFFFARSYAKVVGEVKPSVFEEDLPESNEITHIALMDTDSASILGNRVLGALSHVVSQYDLSENYTQINYHGAPEKVSNLEYDGFFKWLGNMKQGIPGFVMVDPVGSSAQYIEFKNPMYYADSAYFGKDLTRKLRFSYPTKIFDHISFEIDEEGNPYYIVACAKPQVALFGAHDITEVIIFDPTTGESEIMPVEDAPSWIDIVYDGYLASEKYNWQGMYAGGFLNSIIGNVGCKQTTDDFGYIVIGDDVWYFTGVTSISSDRSNIGFILTNARTGEYKFYSVIGAEEHSAMAAAEGEVQEMGYQASFPSLINYAGQPTYIMVLKDAAGLVKLYALVNVENYSIVATGETQAKTMSQYKKLLQQNNVETAPEQNASATVTVSNVRIVALGDMPTVYITGSDGVVYKSYLENDERLILVRVGDSLNVTYTETDIQKIRAIISWEFVTE